MAAADAQALWRPADAEATTTSRFRQTINAKHGLALAHYDDLYEWSTAHIGDFWSAVWDATGVIASERGEHVVDPAARPADAPAWFTGARLNWAENMLRRRDGARALVELIEPHAGLPTPVPRTLSFAELYALVGDLASALLGAGLRPGDRVASYASNCIVSASPPRRQARYLLTYPRTGKRRGVSRGDSDRCVRRFHCLAWPALTHCMCSARVGGHRLHLGQCCRRLWRGRGSRAVSCCGDLPVCLSDHHHPGSSRCSRRSSSLSMRSRMPRPLRLERSRD
jgi:hypothetical protein